jgi:rhodanese-related sulfurtransferase
MQKRKCNKYFLIILCFLGFELQAQIKNQEFKLMLDSLYEHRVPLISVEDLIKLNKKEVYILDTREEEEFNVSHIKNARNVGYFWFDMRNIYDIPMNATIVLYCSVGMRSEKIGKKLLEAGYKNVYNLYGSIFEWANEKYPLVGSNGKTTNRVHSYNKSWSKWVTNEEIRTVW